MKYDIDSETKRQNLPLFTSQTQSFIPVNAIIIVMRRWLLLLHEYSTIQLAVGK